MSSALQLLALNLAAFYALWLLYLAVMNLRRAKKAGLLTPTASALGTPLLVIGLMLDVALNIIAMSIILWELPRVTREPRLRKILGYEFVMPWRFEGTISARLKRHNRESTGWRKAVAAWFEPLLDPFDHTGDHI